MVCFVGVQYCNDGVIAADARLIAAAPELLECLREIVEHHPTLPQIDKATAAIANATGADN